MAAFDEALAEVGEGKDVAVSVSRQGLGSPQGERDGQVDLPEEGGRGTRWEMEVRQRWGMRPEVVRGMGLGLGGSWKLGMELKGWVKGGDMKARMGLWMERSEDWAGAGME